MQSLIAVSSNDRGKKSAVPTRVAVHTAMAVVQILVYARRDDPQRQF
jgi:hypothetical protein